MRAAEPLLTVEEVAERCRTCTQSVREWINKKGLPAAKTGRGWLVSVDDLDAWLRQNASKNTKE
jgi:excisionase family DNA binding protein